MAQLLLSRLIRENLNSTSYDVRLGEYFYRQNQMEQTEILNPFQKIQLIKCTLN